MIYQKVLLHNIEDILAEPGEAGVLLLRVPARLLPQLEEGTRRRYRAAAGSEIRFVCGGEATVLLCCPDGPQTVYLYHGDFQTQAFQVTEKPTAIRIGNAPFLEGCSASLPKARYPHTVKRLLLPRAPVRLLDIQGSDIRPPNKAEQPCVKLLAYGTSITEGIAATHPDLGYISQTAEQLGADAVNLGAAGAAYCESTLAGYIAGRTDWDFAILCISVNMLNQGYSAADFRQRAEYLVTRIRESHPDKHLFCIGLFPFFMDMGMIYPGRHPVSTPEEYRKTLQAIVQDAESSHIHYLDGTELCTNLTGLSSDLLHPSDRGMTEIAGNLAHSIKTILKTGDTLL